MAAPLDPSRFDIGEWATNWTAVNVTSYVPSGKDLFLAGPRMFLKLGSLLQVPGAVENMFGARSIIAEATGAAEAGASGARQTISASIGETAKEFGTNSMDRARSFTGVISYTTSKWALCSLFISLVTNRTFVFASLRRNLKLPWPVRFLVRVLPIFLLSIKAAELLRSIQCQTSPEFAILRREDGSASSESMLQNTMFQNEPNIDTDPYFLHWLSKTLLLGATDVESCLAVRMVPQDYEQEASVDMMGSLGLLWPLFKVFGFSNFVEGLSCVVQGQHMAAETSMSLFEHSLAFAEAESAAGDFGLWGFGRIASGSISDATTRSMMLKRLNTTPEVLLVAFLSAMNHLTSHLFAIFNLQGRLRLINTGFWGLSIMSFLMWSAFKFSIDSNQSLLRFPTVCIVGFIPHVVVLLGILSCSAIYLAALCLCTLAPPLTAQNAMNPSALRSSFMHRLSAAHQNLQANVPLSSVRITMSHDFFTALLKTGLSIMNMATEAVYLNEGRAVSIRPRTFLEDERLQEIDDIAVDLDLSIPDEVGHLATQHQPADLLNESSSGYAREKRLPKKKGPPRTLKHSSSRWLVALEFVLRINKLLLGWWVSLVLRILAKMGLENQSRIMRWLTTKAKLESTGPQLDKAEHNTTNSWLSGVDEVDEEHDGLFEPGDIDDDTTSVVSMTSTEQDWVSDDGNDDGLKTPTQQSPQVSRESSPFTDTPLSSADLARLLQPKTPEERAEAQTLAAHLKSDRILTRSQYRRITQLERSRVLYPPNHSALSASAKLTSVEENQILEELIISRRAIHSSGDSSFQPTAWAKGASGLGEGGTQCVICQSSPRSIIVWPCRCLLCCDACRVALAMNNYDKCVCCRSSVTTFSRMFVP